MKRVLSLVLVLMLVLTSIMPAFAEEPAVSTETADLQSYGVVEGDGTGANEEGVLTRAAMTVLLSKLYGKQAEAEGYELPGTFTDLDGIWSGFVPYIDYAKAQGWMVGYPDDTFKPMNPMSAQAFNSMILVALGYEDVAWADVNAKAEEVGVAITAADPTLVLRGEAFKAIRTALDVTPMGAEVTFGTQLELANYVAPEPPAPEALEVVSVTALNNMQVEVKFNQEIAAAGDEGNYSVDTDGTATITAASDFELLEDGMTVVVTFATAADQQEVLTFAVEDITNEAEEVVADYEEELTFLDTTIPNALGASVVGNDTIKVTFSEPIDDATVTKADFEVNGGDLFINTVTFENNNTEANIELYSALEAGTVEVEIVGAIDDYAGFAVVKTTLSAEVVEDEDGPTLIGYKDATPAGVTLIFDEEIELTDGTAANFYHTNTSNEVEADIVEADDISGMELTLDFTTNSLPQGTAYVYVAAGALNDLWDNTNTKQMLAIEVTLDTTAPEFDEIEVITEAQVELTYTEDLAAADVDNFTLLDEDGEEVDKIDDVTLVGDVITVDFTANLSGEYALVVEDLEDAAGNVVPDQTIPFTVDDLTAPVVGDFSATIYNAGLANQFVIVDFGQAMLQEGTYSVLDADKYEIDSQKLSEIDAASTFTAISTSKVKIAIESVADDATNGVNLSDGVNGITVTRVADAAGNYTVAFTNTFDLDASGTVGIASVEATGLTTIVVTFDDLLETFDADDIIITTDNNNDVDAAAAKLDLAKRSLKVNADGNSELTLTLTSADALDYTAQNGGAVYAYVLAAPNSVNEYDEALATGDTLVDDVIAPVLYSDGDANNDAADFGDFMVLGEDDTFGIIFSEGMVITGGNAIAGNDFVVKAGGTTLVNGLDYAVTGLGTTNVANDTVEFELLGDYLGFDGEFEVDLAATVNYVADAADNAPAAFESGEATMANVPTVDTVTFANITDNDTIEAGEQIVITFVEATDKPVLTGASFAGAGAPNYGDEATFVWNTAGDVLTITLGTTNLDVVATDTVAFAAVDTVEDANGNDFGTGLAYTFADADF